MNSSTALQGDKRRGARCGQEVPQKFTLDGSPNFQLPLSPNPLSPNLPTSVPRPGYGEDRHQSYIPSEVCACLILYNPVGEPASEERNGHLPWGGEEIANLSRSTLTRPWPTGLSHLFILLQSSGRKIPSAPTRGPTRPFEV